MKYFPFLAICSSMTFLPSAVDGQTLYFVRSIVSNTIDRIFFPKRRDESDCNILKGLSQLTNTETCRCEGYATFGVALICEPMKQPVCIAPSNESFCTSASTDDSLESTSFNTAYVAYSGIRTRLSFMSPPVQITRESISGAFVTEPEFFSSFDFDFFLAPSSNEYTDCFIFNFSFEMDDFPEGAYCNSCSICDNGVDFTYDCSNVKGMYNFNNETNTTELGPGPKVDSCFPVASILPLF
jgi:hypothetical protein